MYPVLLALSIQFTFLHMYACRLLNLLCPFFPKISLLLSSCFLRARPLALADTRGGDAEARARAAPPAEGGGGDDGRPARYIHRHLENL